MYYLYHIPGIKVGMTCNIYNRIIKDQGYKPGEFEILAMSKDRDLIEVKELMYQKKFGYKTDKDRYETAVNNNPKSNQMNLNVTEQTVTFPVPLNKLKGYLMDNLGNKIETPYGTYVLDWPLALFIEQNAKVSMFNDNRSYVYNKKLHEWNIQPQAKHDPKPVAEQQESPLHFPVMDFDPNNVYDLIRKWALDKGIYHKGDSKTQYVKLMEEAGELARAILKSNKPEIIDSIGDMIVVLTNLATLEGLKVEDCVVSAYDVIKNRKGEMINGSFVKQTL